MRRRDSCLVGQAKRLGQGQGDSKGVVQIEKNGLCEVGFCAFIVSVVIRMLCINGTGMAECFLCADDSVACGPAGKIEEMINHV